MPHDGISITTMESMSNEKHLVRIGKLLKQAEKAATEEEAATYLAAAKRLSDLYSIDQEMARMAADAGPKVSSPISQVIRIGNKRTPRLRTYAELFMAIGRTNDVKFDVSATSDFVVAFGLPDDIAATELMYSAMLPQMVSAAVAYIRRGEWKQEQVLRKVRHTNVFGDFRYVDEWTHPTSHTARTEFQLAFATRIGARLEQSRTDTISDVDGARETSSGPSAAVVLRNKAVKIADFHAQTSKARGKWRGAKSPRQSRLSREAGDAAGRAARLGGSQDTLGGNRNGISA